MQAQTLIREEFIGNYIFHTYEVKTGFILEVRHELDNQVRYREEMSTDELIQKLENALKVILDQEGSLHSIYNIDYSE
jgi:20S proteasome alpha/beta subunit